MFDLALFQVLLVLVIGFVNYSEQSTPLSPNATFCYSTDSTCGFSSAEWPGVCQTGQRQSPIDLVHNGLTRLLSFANPRPLNFNGNYKSSEFYIRNNGHSIQVSFTSNLSSNAAMSGYGFDYPYTFAQAHFHWGKDVLVGSEHTINGEHLPMEVHLVHYDSKYASYSDAATASDPKSLAVVAVFLQPFMEFNFNSAFDTIAANVQDNYETSVVKIAKPLDLTSLLPRRFQSYYRYNGSLTTPGCSEIVEWTVIPDPIPIRPSSFFQFRKIHDEEGTILAKNARPTQKLFNRPIEYHNVA